MPKIELNLTEAESLKPIEEGPYPARVIEVGNVKSGKKAQYVPVKLEISEGEYEGRTFYNNLPIDGKGAGIFIDFVNKALDLDHDVDEMEDLAFDTDELIGAGIIINIKNEEYPEGSGEIRSGIKSTARLVA